MKTPLSLSIAILAAAFVFAGCKKKNKEVTTRVEGQILTFGTSDPAVSEPVKIQLEEYEFNSYLIADETYTDANGRFVLETTTSNDNVDRYLISIEDKIPNHNSQRLDPGGIDNRNGVEKGFQGTKNIYLSPHAWAKFHIKNVDPQPGDIFSIDIATNFERFHGSVDVLRKYKVFGNTETVIFYSLYRNGTYANWQDTIFMPAFDTTLVKVEY